MRRAELILNSSAFISKKLFSRRFVARDLHGAKSIWLYALHDNVLKLKRINFFFKCCADAFFLLLLSRRTKWGEKQRSASCRFYLFVNFQNFSFPFLGLALSSRNSEVFVSFFTFSRVRL